MSLLRSYDVIADMALCSLMCEFSTVVSGACSHTLDNTVWTQFFVTCDCVTTSNGFSKYRLINLNSINKHLLHASQMHIHAYIRSVWDSEPYSGIQGRREHLWTLVDPDLYMRHVDIFSHYSLYFSFLIFHPKGIIIPHIINNYMTDFPHHHSIMYDFTPLYSPVSFTFSCYL